jgi:hypothetical protein
VAWAPLRPAHPALHFSAAVPICLATSGCCGLPVREPAARSCRPNDHRALFQASPAADMTTASATTDGTPKRRPRRSTSIKGSFQGAGSEMSLVLGRQRWLAIRPAAAASTCATLPRGSYAWSMVVSAEPACQCRSKTSDWTRERDFPWLPQKRLDHFHRDSPPLLLRGVELGNLDIARKVILEICHRLL